MIDQLGSVDAGTTLTDSLALERQRGISGLLPATVGDADAPVCASIFKIERGSNAEKITYLRVFAGTVRIRDRVHLGAGAEGKVTGLAVFERGAALWRPCARAGQIARVWGAGTSPDR